MKITIFSFLLSVCSFIAFGQELILVDAQPIDSNRYDDIQGNPFLWKEWQTGKLLPVNGEEITDVRLNYNGLTGLLEVKNEGNYVALEPEKFWKIEVKGEAMEQEILQMLALGKFGTKFVRRVYWGDQLKVVAHFSAKEVVKKINDVGKTRELKSFARKNQLYLIKDGNTVALSRGKKGLMTDLTDDTKALKKHLKSHKLKIDKEADLIEVLKWLEDKN